MIFKKVLFVRKSRLSLVKIFFFSVFLFLQSNNAFGYTLCTGAYVVNQSPIGEASEYLINAFGGGLVAEFDITKNFAQTIRIQYAGVIPKIETIKSAWQFSQFLGLRYLYTFGESGFSFVPGIEVGLMFQGAKTKDEYGKLPKNAYTDFTVQFSPSFRYRHEKVLKGLLEFEASPVYTLVPQKTGGLAFFGIRIVFCWQLLFLFFFAYFIVAAIILMS